MSTRRPAHLAAARELMRDGVLDTVGELLSDRQWGGVTMGQVAEGAGVSRQTLYNEFGDRAGLAQAYVLREGDRFLVEVERAIAEHEDDPEGALHAALGTFLAAAEGHPVMRAIAAGGGDELLELVTTRGAPILTFATDRLAAALVHGWPSVRERDARDAAQVMVRLALSHATLPTAPPDATASMLARVLGPYLRAALDEARRAQAA